MNEPENPLVLIGFAAVLLIGVLVWNSFHFTRDLNAFEGQCHATGGQIIHPRGEVLCIRDGRITGWMRA